MITRRSSNGGFLLSIILLAICAFFIVQIAIVLNQNYNYHEIDSENLLFTLVLGDNATNEDNGVKCSQENVDSQTSPSPQQTAIISEKVDGFFNGNPIHYQQYEDGWHSNVHCIGDNFGPDAWRYRSCHFQNFCFDLKNQSFVLFTSPEQHALDNALNHANLTSFSASFSFNTTVSIGGINPKWGNGDKHMEWFPQLKSIDDVKESGYYMFSNDVALVPFHSMAGFNPGHLVWDDFLPIYNLLTMFQLLEKDLVLMRYKPKFWQWASCDRRWNSGRLPHCKTMLKKFLPLIGQQLETMTTQENVDMKWEAEPMKSKYVCARNGAAGMGYLTDHGSKLHGWLKKDFEFTQNLGRGTLLYDFRNWMLANINIKPDKSIAKSPFKIVFSIGSSSTSKRNASFKEQMKRLRESLSTKYPMEIVSHKLSSMSLEEQIELVSGASIMVTMCGGGKALPLNIVI